MEKLKDLEKTVKKTLKQVLYIVNKPVRLTCSTNLPQKQVETLKCESVKSVKEDSKKQQTNNQLETFLKGMSHEDECENQTDEKVSPYIIDLNEKLLVGDKQFYTKKLFRNKYSVLTLLTLILIIIVYIIWNISIIFSDNSDI